MTGAPEFIACHACDALLREPPLTPGARARCPRCDAVLNEGRAHSTDGVIASAAATIALLITALNRYAGLVLLISWAHSSVRE